MASSYNNPLKIEEIGTGEQAGTWGDTTNVNIADALPEAITGRATATFPSDANYTLPYIDSNAPQVFRNLVLNVTSSGNLSATRDLIVPEISPGVSIEKQYFVENNTSGGQSIRIKTASGTGVTIPNGRIANVYCDGTNVRFSDDYVSIAGGSISLDTLSFGTQTNKATLSYTTNTARTLTVPALGGNRTFAFLEEAQTFTQTQTFSTIVVGTQTNKATISYTTDAARTLTIPAVSGNRTFAFLEEAQTFTAAQTFNADQTIAANAIFSGNARRIQGNFVGYNTNATLFQTTVTNGGTSVGAIPNGTGNNAAFAVYGSADAANTAAGGVYVDNDEVSFFSAISGTGTYRTVYISNGGFGRIAIDSSGEIGINSGATSSTSLTVSTGGTRTYSIKGNGRVQFSDSYNYTVGATNRTLYIDSTGDIGGLSSTRESKKNIAPIENVDWLMALEPVSYNRRIKTNEGVYTEEVNPNTEFGLIADDVANVRPEICVFDNGKVAGINYEQLIAPMLKEIQNLRAEIAALKEKLNG